ncbi:transcriptional regulator [Mycolicibacterium chitae]|uniref:Transcriptional regulator, luxR family n=3 Tax=Mycolicibacterium chitae TaxID=1792 RepID=A0A448I5F9_MYCCI|nr:helix-turn-helix transcriptional regulator [Mycolicibacterium chitae]BBZ03958.1 transcriptional regulator [Mycolicibacterium chitae]VEG47610.1 transcriptional regulator, luxR family [Mycolicibacterium chitae]
MTREDRASLLRGRDRECAELQTLVADVGAGCGQALVLRGEAGIGKSALLDFVGECAGSAGFRIAQVAGVQSDMELAFAGLHQLCAPLLDHMTELPEPQREALAVAFGRGVGPAPDRFLVGLAVLSLLATAAEEQPVLCIVDDAQWLDQVSVQTLGFVARRLLAEPVGVVFAVRDGGPAVLTGLTELRLDGLSDSDARALLDAVVLGRLDERVRDRIVAETRGNPLAVLEVPRNFSPAELAGGFGNAGARPSAGQVEESFVRRIRLLPTDTQLLVLTAAAEPVGDTALFQRAAGHLGIPVEALGPAEAAGVIEFGSRMRFHHPLVRSAAYAAADLVDRRAIHRALAEATDRQSDPDRRAWHAANATAGTDDAVAAQLEASAGRAQSRGGVAAAAAFLERAAVLTADPGLRGARAIAAARAKRDAAASEAAYELLALAELGPLSALQRAQVARLRAQIDFVRCRGGDPAAPRLSEVAARLRAAAEQLDGLDRDLARETYLESLAAAMYAGRLGAPEALANTAAAALAAVHRDPDLQRPIDVLLGGMATRITGGPGCGAELLGAALATMCAQLDGCDGQPPRWMSLGLAIVQESAAGELWDDAVMNRMAAGLVRAARAAGALAALPPALAYHAGVHVLAGELSTAATLLEEADAITAATGYTPVRYHSLTIAAWRGDAAEALGLIAGATADAAARGEGRLLGLTGYASAVLYNGLGRYEEAFDCAREACEFEDLGFYSWTLYEMIEAAVHTGRRDIAARGVRRFERRVGASPSGWARGAVASAQALVADNEHAEALFGAAIDHFVDSGVNVHLARIELSYGEWLRRVNRRGDARQQLTTAAERFAKMGANAFAERARRELVAVGAKVRRRPLRSGDALTAQEGQIARLAADGLTNHEIGAQLFLSTHTVEWHLRKVFVKLGISSRRQLRTATWAH